MGSAVFLLGALEEIVSLPFAASEDRPHSLAHDPFLLSKPAIISLWSQLLMLHFLV